MLNSYTSNNLIVCKQIINKLIELLVLDYNPWNYLTVCKQLINIKLDVW